ncbi:MULTISPECIES: helix-turn-helix domain-containing protein [Microbacterium]|uniref:helix-turn-helix domain-containing protein n=1 Tax=Microbacterium TaxID=33882 RepID=UPI00277F54DA|nr:MULTISPECIES: AraC family transcriptional regulator [Microbacterium]MDQ1082453.1 AraC-like DNA-binding protein [Microbacterium sp. SORGH_AS_0344]MDQ1168775.1 AraC-like DNA-binding protein [Microbacterium proteolyticum]
MTSELALERALSAIDVRPGRAGQRAVGAGESLTLAPGAATLIYVRTGELTGHAAERSACSLDASTGAAAVVPADGRTLLAGDAFISLGCLALALVSRSGAEVTVVPLEVTPTPDTMALPPVLFVSGFARAEPAAAGLAAHLGLPAPGAPTGREGDETICKLMVATVLLSALRAWASAGRDATWPPPVTDPFLARVVAAVDADPGREWTIDHLAALGAMSRSVFAARFREVFGTSPAAHVTEVRMRRARQLLEAGTPVTETSRALGYGSDEGFRRAFRRHTGVAPSAWRAGRRSVAT